MFRANIFYVSNELFTKVRLLSFYFILTKPIEVKITSGAILFQ